MKRPVMRHAVPDASFRGFIWEPTTEQEVVMLFGILLQRNAFETPICMERARTTFPDCTAVNPVSGQRVNIEFEYASSEFLQHREEWEELRDADPNAQWWLVCWKDNLTDKEKAGLPELRIEVLKHFRSDPPVVLNPFNCSATGEDYAKAFFDWRSRALPKPYPTIIARLLKFGDSEKGFRIGWPEKPDPRFVVWTDDNKVQCFAVSADGTLGVPFSKWRNVPPGLVSEVIRRLNTALNTTWFTGRERKKKGFDAAALLRKGEAIDPFLDVWRWFSRQRSRAMPPDAASRRLTIRSTSSAGRSGG